MKSTNTSTSFLLCLFIVLFAVLVNSTNVGIPIPLPPCDSSNHSNACVWDSVNKNSDTVRLVLIDVVGSVLDKNLLDLVAKVQLLGINVFAKIKVGQAQRSLIDVKADIDLALKLYHIDGVFFDEVPLVCSPYFDDLYAHVKLKLGGLVILNVGVNVPECFALVSDVLVLFDSTYTDYLKYKPSPWCKKYPPSTFWHVIRGCPPEKQRSALIQAIKNRAGFIYLTADVDLDLSGKGPLLDLDLTLLVRLLRLLNLDLLLDLKLL
jgi:hypothetical protein